MTGFKHAAFFIASLAATGMTLAADWQEPWSVVKGRSVEKCAETFQDYQMQAICMDNEKAGYKEMQKDYGMPHDIASKAKERCEQVFAGLFQMQNVCMKNEKAGYDKMSAY
jgi:hypothetical protein